MANCPNCGAPANVRPLVKESKAAHHNDALYADCTNACCVLKSATLPLVDFLTLTPTQIQGYAAAEARLQARYTQSRGAHTRAETAVLG